MGSFDNRSESRKKACFQAFVSDLADTVKIKCVIRDVSGVGCQVVSSRVHELPEFVQVVPEGFERPIIGRIAWRKEKSAGISFQASTDETVVAKLQDIFRERLAEAEVGDRPVLLEEIVPPLGYARRLAKYNPRNK